MPVERSREFLRIERLYLSGRIGENGLAKAVELGLITAEEKTIIMEEKEQ